MDWNEVSAAAAVVAACAAVVAVCFQVWSTRFTMRVQLSQQLENAFYYDEQMIDRRRRAATALLEGRFVYEVDEILNFLDTIGMLVRRNVLDEELAFHSFGRRVLCYWEFARRRVLEVRQSYPNTWSDIDYLVGLLQRRQKKGAVDWRPLLLREAEMVPERQPIADGAGLVAAVARPA